MKKIVLIALVLLTVVSCGKRGRGELVGVKQKKWFPEKPFKNSTLFRNFGSTHSFDGFLGIVVAAFLMIEPNSTFCPSKF